MTRENKPRETAKTSVKPEALLEKIISDALQAQTLSFKDWWALSGTPMSPLAIPITTGRELRVTQAGVDTAHELTALLWRSRQDLRQTLSRKEFDRVSFTAIGQAVANARTHLPAETPGEPDREVDDAFLSAVASDFHRNVDQLANQARHDVVRHIPCHLFHLDQEVPAFAVGPVEFLPRPDWIARYVIDPGQRVAIEAVESRSMSYEAFRAEALKPGSTPALYTAWSILSALGNFTWVASIGMSKHALDQSHRKASIFVGLAIDAIGLRFDLDSARKLTKAGRQHLFSENRLATSDSGAFLGGFSVQMPGLGSAPGALAAKMAAERAFLDAAGKVLSSYVSGRQTGRAPHLVERWANALYWVGEARREASDFMAVVDYGCAADGLSKGGGSAKDIIAFAEVALNPKKEATPVGVLSVAEAVTRVYMEGRNKLAHGETSGLLEDLEDVRRIGDNLLLHLLDAVTFELAEVLASRPQYLELDEKQAYRAFYVRLEQRTLADPAPP